MQGIHLNAGKLSYHTDLSPPTANADEALVRVRLAGICGTDLQMIEGYAAFNGIPGHEFVGIVTEAVSAPHWIGQRVVGEINIGCGHCALCLAGESAHCSQRKVLGIRDKDGAFADLLTLPIKNLHPIPDEISDEQAVFVEPLAAAIAVLESVSPSEQDQVLVIGAGRLGLLIAQVLRDTGCDLQVLCRRPEQFALLQSWGITGITATALKPRTMGLIVEASGSAQGLASALNAIRPRGQIILKSTYTGRPQLDLARLVVDEIRLSGSRCGPFERAIEYLKHGRIDTNSLITRIFSFRDTLTAYHQASQPGALKVLLAPN